jgi:Tfp pilus assembly protein PilV
VLIEVLVSALVVVIATAGVAAVLQTSVRSQTQERHGSEAYAIAQEDQARMTSMRLASLNRLAETRTVTLNETVFKVKSTGVFVNDTTSTPSCGEGTSSADYVQITSTVSWPGMRSSEKAEIESILSPSNGSLDPNNGTIAFSVKNQPQYPMPGVAISSVGGAINGLTDAGGCAVFADLPGGDYDVKVSGEAVGLVGKSGQSFEEQEVTVVGGDTKTFNYEFDKPGTVPLQFKYRVGNTTEFKPATADTVVGFNSGMSQARILGTPGGTRQATLNATPLFPFASAYTFYAGSCSSNNPDPKGEFPALAPAFANVIAPAGATATPGTIQLPALELVVKKDGVALSGAKVTITDRVCKDSSSKLVKRIYTTNAAGQPSNGATGVAEPGLPWGSYDLCASATISGNPRNKPITNVSVKDLTKAATATIDLGSGFNSGACP